MPDKANAVHVQRLLDTGGADYAALLEAAVSDLKEAGVPDPETDARALLFHCFGLDMTGYLLRRREKAGTGADSFLNLLEQRCARIPLQHLLGTAYFMGLAFDVSENVLIPRPDTETLAEEAISRIRQKNGACRVLDLCTGSGCIAVALKKMCPQIDCFAADISEKALQIAAGNAAKNDVQVTFVRSDLFEALPAGSRFDLIVSNPPYIPSGEIDGLEIEVACHDPRLALDGGEDGMDFYRRICADAGGYLAPGGSLLLEIGYDQGGSVGDLCRRAGFKNVHVRKDLAGMDRVVCAKR